MPAAESDIIATVLSRLMTMIVTLTGASKRAAKAAGEEAAIRMPIRINTYCPAKNLLLCGSCYGARPPLICLGQKTIRVPPKKHSIMFELLLPVVEITTLITDSVFCLENEETS